MIVWLIILIVSGIDALPAGAPSSACSTLMPLHANTPAQTSQSPYDIHAELTGNKVTVHISSPDGEAFQGFMLQARSSQDPNKFIDGEFSTTGLSRTIDCFAGSKNTLTHVSPTSKTEILTEWTPKANLNEAVIFKATVAKQYSLFWTELYSNPVEIKNNAATDIEKKSLYERCFKEEGCVGLPYGCVEKQDCQILLKYSKSSNGIDFSLHGILESSMYMAMALSEDAIMGGDSVTECIRDGTSVIARESWNEGKSNTRTRELSRDSYTATFGDGLTTCSWTSPLITTSNERTYNFADKSFYILLAAGQVSEWKLRYHGGEKLSSPEALRLTEVPGKSSTPEMEDGSHETTEYQHPVSSTDDDEVTIVASRSSCLSICLILIISGLFFVTKQNMNVCIFK